MDLKFVYDLVKNKKVCTYFDDLINNLYNQNLLYSCYVNYFISFYKFVSYKLILDAL